MTIGFFKKRDHPATASRAASSGEAASADAQQSVGAIAALVIVGVTGGVFALMSWTLQRFPQLTCTPQRSS
jgi:hypothetical protein